MNPTPLSPRDLDLLTFVYHSAGATIDLRYDRYRVNRLLDLAAKRLVKLVETGCPDKLMVSLYPAGCRALGLSEHTYKTKVRRRANPVITWERQRRESLVPVSLAERPACLCSEGITVLRPRRQASRPATQPVAATSQPSPFLVVKVAKTGKVNMASTILNVCLTLAREGGVSGDQVHSYLCELTPVTHRASYTRAYLRDWVRKGYLSETTRDLFVGTGKLD